MYQQQSPMTGTALFTIKLEPAIGFEPTTRGLRNRCSTPELRWLLEYYLFSNLTVSLQLYGDKRLM
jgi:hypothetical protein